jgi:hypothetical protein
MITRFFNYGTGVYVLGRYYDSSIADYTTGSAEIKTTHVVNALAGVPVGDYSIVSVSETLTNPTFVLSGGGSISGPGLQYFEIVLQIEGSYFTVSFDPPSTISRKTTASGALITEQVFPMRWNAGTTKAATTRSYCTRAPLNGIPPGDDDNVVFQQGILVNALTADMNRDNAYVTLSCQLGAIARARLWGYAYRGTQAQADMFETVMHMKRASYCGDASFFTRRATEFFIKDSAGINDDGAGIITSTSGFEATWGYHAANNFRALCVNMVDRRHPNALYLPPNWTGGSHDAFTGDCDGNGTVDLPLDNCPLPPSNLDPAHSWWVASQADPSP